MNLVLGEHKLNRISETVACTTPFVAIAQQREYLHLIHIDKYPNA